ncbi:hypothetical protein F2Q70_00022074 [Brassica cretica]|uniref:MATH domain-containing protein n=2 Tax=Brassica cretica TaxID=69181 RepID=A0A3N6UD89_BRACR|nr:hypothetical protein F2Q70_00022074 [Brassica cretica]KAF2556481.1 hypothetical protein F2Q68_00015877 [Brassica cretica]KAF3606882.1 hypothetical protein DY000_02048428 [Brassica cretica]
MNSLEEKFNHLVTGITRTRRVEAASSYSLKLVGLSEIKAGSNVRSYESDVFTASGYQWRLILYPLGNDNDGGKDHFSIYVRLETLVSNLPKNWEIQVDMKFLVFNQNHKKYLTVQAQFIELSTLKDQKNGYAVKDTCTFRVDIAILKPAEKLETVTFLHNPPNNKFTWKIFHFSNLSDQEFVLSDQFLAGQRYWKIRVDPKREREGVGVYIVPQTHLPNCAIASSYVMFKLKIRNQLNGNHIERTDICNLFLSSGDRGHGVPKLITQKDLYDKSKGFLVKDTIILEVEMLCMSQTQVISK